MGKRLVWDIPTRIFHWVLALSIVASWATAELDDAMDLHLLLGYLATTLILFRIVWGFVGTRHARFAGFLRGPAEIRRYVTALRAGTASKSVGHNPLGSISVVAMLLAVVVQVLLGMFSSDGDMLFTGPYNGLLSEHWSDTISELHEANFKVIAALAIVHISAVLWYLIRRRDNLITPMLTGRKDGDLVPAEEGIPNSRLGLAVVVLALCVLAVWALVTFAPPPPELF